MTRKTVAAIWGIVCLAALIHLGLKIHDGLHLGSDLTALLPHEQRDPKQQAAIKQVSASLSRQILLIVGHTDRNKARSAAAGIARAMRELDLIEPVFGGQGREAIERVGGIYFPHRSGLLSQADRQRLMDGQAKLIAERATAQLFGFVGMNNAKLVRGDPFLLLPAFLTDLPVSSSRFALDDGMVSARENGQSWVLLAYRLKDEPFALAVQRKLVGQLDDAYAKQLAGIPDLKLLRTGAVFYAHSGAQKSVTEGTRIVIVSVICIVAMVLIVFRAIGPLLQSLLAITIGILCALSLSLAIFRELHIVALLFGTSLIGTTVDYSLHYCCDAYAGGRDEQTSALRNVLPGLTLGVMTTLIGYLALLLAPLQGLHQIAVFSVIGIVASFATVVLWFPFLDRPHRRAHRATFLRATGHIWNFWRSPRHRPYRAVLVVLFLVTGAIGLTQIAAIDDIRRMQTPPADLQYQRAEIQRITGMATSMQYFLVQALDGDTALQREEALASRLAKLRSEGVLTGFRGPAQFVPSAARQRDNARLVRQRLLAKWQEPHLARLGLKASDLVSPARNDTLTLDRAVTDLPMLRNMILTGGGKGASHIVFLDEPLRVERLRSAAADLKGVKFVDPAFEISQLLGKYRRSAAIWVAVSAFLMIVALIRRYGPVGALRVMAPPIAAVALTPGFLALAGRGFTFFDTMALILVLAIGVDYAVFCAEAAERRRPVTMLAVTMAALSTILAFGLLAFSSTFAVQSFGATMMCGIVLAFLLSPFAGGATPRSRA